MSDVVCTKDKENLKKDAQLEHLPTDLTYQLRMAVSGYKSDEFLSWGYQWEDKPHRLVWAACGEAEYLSAEVERLREELAAIVEKNKPEIAAANTHLGMLEYEIAAMNRMLDDYEKENEKLREALEYYAKQHELPNDGPWGINSDDFGSVARAALEGK